MALVKFSGQTVLVMKETSAITKLLGMASFSILMEMSTMEIGLATKLKAREST